MIADFAESEGADEDAASIQPPHLAEALQHRPRMLQVSNRQVVSLRQSAPLWQGDDNL